VRTAPAVARGQEVTMPETLIGGERKQAAAHEELESVVVGGLA
jgi:hypothetical protein